MPLPQLALARLSHPARNPSSMNGRSMRQRRRFPVREHRIKYGWRLTKDLVTGVINVASLQPRFARQFPPHANQAGGLSTKSVDNLVHNVMKAVGRPAAIKQITSCSEFER
jgi:hypothetical protein